MTRKLLALGLLATATATALAADPAPKADPAKPAVQSPDPTRKTIRWPGGWMYQDEPGVIYHTDGTVDGKDDKDAKPAKVKGVKKVTVAGPTTIITDSVNGNNNTFRMDTGKPGVTILRNVRNGNNNNIVVTPEGVVIDLTPKAPAPKPDEKK